MDTGALHHTSQRKKSRTYLPRDGSRENLVDLARYFKEIDTHLDSVKVPSLKSADGTERELPPELFEVLEQVVSALANGNGVTVAPYGMQLTTQEAADYLGISRPTLVKLLVSGEIAHEMRGRHRRVTLRDLVEYQDRSSVERRSTLSEMAREGLETGMADAPTIDFQRLTSTE